MTTRRTTLGSAILFIYNAPGVKVSIFVYDRSRRGLGEGIDSPATQQKFAEAKADLQQANLDAQVMVGEERLSIAGVPLLHAAYQYTKMRPESREAVFSHLYLTSRRGTFLKVRATYSATDRPNLGHRVHVQFVEHLCPIIGKSDWVVVNKFGDSKCFLDRTSVEKNNGLVRAWVKYALTPPGMDKINMMLSDN